MCNWFTLEVVFSISGTIGFPLGRDFLCFLTFLSYLIYIFCSIYMLFYCCFIFISREFLRDDSIRACMHDLNLKLSLKIINIIVNFASPEIYAFECYFTRRCIYFYPRSTRNTFHELICMVKSWYGRIGGIVLNFWFKILLYVVV